MDHENALLIAEASKNAPDPKTGAAAWQGRWKNQMGSTMDLAVAGKNITGTYTSASSDGGGPVMGEDLKGYVSGDLISFTVLWPSGSITSWTGQLVDDQTMPCLNTLWQLVTDVPDPAEHTKLWLTTLTGADQFTRS